MSGFPRSCFLEKELDATRWYAKKNGVTNQPTIKQVKNHRDDIIDVAGLNTRLVEGKLGNCFAINDWYKIISHEFANPLIRPHLHLYPEDTGERLEEARQAAKWKDEVDANIAVPMARDVNGKDYYVEEPCLAHLNNGGVCPVLPIRWFMRGETLIAIVHLLHITPQLNAFIIDGTASGCIELPLSAFFLSVVDLQDPACQARYGLPSPHKIAGALK
ncbi:hypothetical protein C8J57DRAFT_1096269 [Mycena rebaudengoi]|nr:hypothetical protein C8J57DRAFT_1096269 [Mycena rebaudengoi]